MRVSLWPVCDPWPLSDWTGEADRAACGLVTVGGDDGIRTHDPLLANQDGRNAVLTRTFAPQRRARTSKLSADQTGLWRGLVILRQPR
jgi:hypothetical protein